MEKNIDSKKKIDLSKELDFNDIDLTAPDIVIKEILSQIPEQTKNIISGKIESYSGYVKSHKRTVDSIVSIGRIFEPKEITVDVQDSLGARGEERKKFECFLYTEIYKNYKYRLFFVEYGISEYPVALVVEKSIADSIFPRYAKDDIFICNNRGELEDLVCAILTCNRTLSVMQEIVRIAQVKKQETTNTDKKKEDW